MQQKTWGKFVLFTCLSFLQMGRSHQRQAGFRCLLQDILAELYESIKQM